MKKRVKKIANTSGITFTKEEMQIYNIELGDLIDLSDITVEKNVKLGDEE